MRLRRIIAVTGRAKGPDRASFTGHDPALRRNLPESLRTRSPANPAFAHGPAKAEDERQQSEGRGSSMVKQDRPAPALRPRNEDQPIRAAFEAAWLKEQRAAMLARFRDERADRSDPARERDRPRPVPGRER